VAASDSGDDPDEELWHFVCFLDESHNRGSKFGGSATLEAFPAEFGKLTLDGVEPGTGCWRE